MQITKTSFIFEPGSLSDRFDLGDRQIHAYIMRYVLNMLYKRIKENLLMKLIDEADKTVLYGYTNLAKQLGY